MIDYCKDKNLDYECNTPDPQNPGNKSRNFCPTVGSSYYDPANCDPGYWCGCSEINKTKCIPQNNSEHWSGHFTTNSTNGKVVIFSPQLGGEQWSKCLPGMLCAGKTIPFLCPDSCPPGKICKTTAFAEDCPKGGYCPVSSTVEIKCKGLQECNDSGQRRFTSGPAAMLLGLSLVLSVAGLFFFQRKITKSARVRKTKKMEKAKEKKEKVVEAEKSFHKSILPVISNPIDIEFDRIRLTLPNIGTIMQGASGSLKHGTVTAIMGPTGAGKTTMLNLLSGKVDRTSGIIKINGEEKEMCEFKDVIGFAPQVDTMHRELTVEEVIIHNALMRLPVNMSEEEKLQRVDDVLEVLEIDHVRDTVIGDARVRGLSGGQLKRVNIAMEMVSNPNLICLDEPTSGLDSLTSFVVLKALKEMAQTGVNVIVVLHQPKQEIFDLFNQVLLLAKGGLTAFIGSPIEMISYFDKLGFPIPPGSNHADFVMDVLGGVVQHPSNPDFKTEDFVLAWMTADENPNSMSLEDAKSLLADAASDVVDKVTMSSRLKKVRQYFSDAWVHFTSGFKNNSALIDRAFPGIFEQTLLLTYRAFLQRIRRPKTTFLILLAFLIFGALTPGAYTSQDNFLMYKGILKGFGDSSNLDNLGVTSYLRENVHPMDNIPGFILNVLGLTLAIICSFSVTVLDGNERLVFFRETSTGQSVVAYFLSKTIETIVSVPLYTAAYLLYQVDVDVLLIQSTGTFYLFATLATFFMFAVGYLCSLLFEDNACLISLVVNIMITLLFTGLVFRAGDTSSSYLGFCKCFPSFWSSQGIITEELEQYKNIFDITRLNSLTPNTYDSDFGAPNAEAGAGVGSGWDLGKGVGGNSGYCILALFGWYLLVLLTMKMSSFKKHR